MTKPIRKFAGKCEYCGGSKFKIKEGSNYINKTHTLGDCTKKLASDIEWLKRSFAIQLDR